MEAIFSQLIVLGSSLILLLGLILLWRRGVPAYVNAFAWQSIILAGVTAVVARYGQRRDLYWVAGLLLVVKGVAIPWLLSRPGSVVTSTSSASRRPKFVASWIPRTTRT